MIPMQERQLSIVFLQDDEHLQWQITILDLTWA